ncbi:MAG: cytochrome c [Acidobacteriia bacterium]|nr:cytochrome c [Terriglobia bacterium]
MFFRLGPLGLLAPLALFGGSPTFHKEIEPILQHRCQGCHRPGEAGPMPLLSYQDARPWAKAIRAAVLSGKMPPWQADPHYGKFTNDPSLTQAEKDELVAWVDGGAREGLASDAPKPVQFTEGWRIAKPDVVFEMPREFSVPAKGAIDYQYIPVATNFTEDKWVAAVEVRPGDRSVVHHAIVMVDSGNGERGQEYLAGYAPGMTPQTWKPGQARLIKAGSYLVFQMHYQATGKPAKDRTRIGLIFAKKPAAEQIVGMQAAAHWLAIPAGEPNYRVQAMEPIRETSYLVGMRAHMHLRGKSFMFRAIYPNGDTEILLNVPKYDFNWQPYYYLETPKLLPKGTRIEATAVFDNSPNNPFNPNPNATVFWGPQTWDEMMIGWFDLAVPVKTQSNLRHTTGLE